MREFVGRLATGGPPRPVADPAPAEVEGCLVLFRGYVANRAALDAEARRRGHPEAPSSDAGRLALACRWWGPQLSRNVLGEYAAAIHDPARGTLVLAHDELGLVPLFYAAGPGGICFGSPLEAVVAETGVGELDEEYVADYFAQGEHFGDRTPFADVRRVRPGECVAWRDGRLTRHSTWTLGEVRPLRCRDEREYAEGLGERVEEAVAAALPGEGVAWCELSGGLDSSTVFGLASRLGAPGLQAVSLVYPRSVTADERKWIGFVLEAHPAPWNPVDADAVRPFTELPGVFYGEPSSRLVTGGLSRVLRGLFRERGVDVVLTGQGGDAVFLGDVPRPYFLADLLRRGRWAEAWRQARAWGLASYDHRPTAFWLAHCGAGAALRRLRGRWIEGSPVTIPWATDGFAARARLAERGRATPAPAFATVAESYHAERVIRNAVSVAAHYAHAGLGAEYRHPLFHRPLLEYMLSVPWKAKYRPGEDRVLQRRALEGILPGRTLRRTGKRGPDEAFYEGLEAAGDWFEMLTSTPRIVERGYAVADRWREAVRQARIGRTVGARHFLASVNLEVWLRQLERFSSRPRLARPQETPAPVRAPAGSPAAPDVTTLFRRSYP